MPAAVLPNQQLAFMLGSGAQQAIAIASLPGVVFASFGDMLRVPGSSKDLLSVKADGGDVRIVYSPLVAVRIAQQNPAKKVVFFAVGFETTAPANAMAVWQANKLGLKNFSLLCSLVLVPPALEAILSSPGHRVQGILAAGHVCTVTGFEEYIPLSAKYNIPIVVTGFEPVDILQGVFMSVSQLEKGQAVVENQYARAARLEGNRAARSMMEEVLEITDRQWRGIGVIPKSGYRLRTAFSRYDAENIFDVQSIHSKESSMCIAGDILRGLTKPYRCSIFGTQCTPEHPQGAPMVSSEGACAAYYHYGKHAVVAGRPS